MSVEPREPWRAEWFLGGHAILDLANTVPWRLDPEHIRDRLPDATALLGWALMAELIDTRRADELHAETVADPGAAEAVVAEVRDAREGFYEFLRPVATGDAPRPAAVEALRRVTTEALTRAEITAVVPLRWNLPIRTLGDLPVALGLSAWHLVQFDDLSRLRQCQDRGCGWLFLDRTKNASRVWCSSADCGNRTRVRRHHQRHAAPHPGSSPGRRTTGR